MQFYVYLTALQLEHHIINIMYWVKKRSYSSWWNEPSSNINWQKCITFRFSVWHNLTSNCEGKGELVEWTMEQHWQKCIYSEIQCLTPFYFELQRSGHLPHHALDSTSTKYSDLSEFVMISWMKISFSTRNTSWLIDSLLTTFLQSFVNKCLCWAGIFLQYHSRETASTHVYWIINWLIIVENKIFPE
jgi:hypothetical protein